MSIISNLQHWFDSKFRRHRLSERARGPREFVYLDETSVYSILASRKGAIATEFRESHTESLKSGATGSIGMGLGSNKWTVASNVQAGQVEKSQVLRKAIIQTIFKELYDLECGSLGLRLLHEEEAPKIQSVTQLEAKIDSLLEQGWLVDLRRIGRGDLLEVEVELEADPIFRLATVITTLCDLINNNSKLLDPSMSDQFAQIRSIAPVLERLLAGLVPVRGHLIDYQFVRINNRDLLVHRSLVNLLAPKMESRFDPVVVVGVAQQDLFWKDIRQLLFSNARYTVFGRLVENGITDTWQPVKLADVFSGIAPDIDNSIRELSRQIGVSSLTSDDAIHTATTSSNQDPAENLVRTYLGLIADYHGKSLKSRFTNEMIDDVLTKDEWIDTIDRQRLAFDLITRRVDSELGSTTSKEIAHRFRCEARKRVGIDDFWSSKNKDIVYQEPRSPKHQDKFLDVEIIAIYW